MGFTYTRFSYLFGQVWVGKRNGLSFYNSLKMKISVIVGVVQVNHISRARARGVCVSAPSAWAL